jgi:biotin operon repressor
VTTRRWALSRLVTDRALDVLRDHSRDGVVTLSLANLGREIGCSRTCAWRAVHDLIDSGAVVRTVRGGGRHHSASTYLLTPASTADAA